MFQSNVTANDRPLLNSTFGSKFVVLYIVVELCEGLQCKLQMFGVSVDGPIDILCDNNAIVNNTTLTKSILSKMHTSILP
jgi:hypothetical protein